MVAQLGGRAVVLLCNRDSKLALEQLDGLVVVLAVQRNGESVRGFQSQSDAGVQGFEKISVPAILRYETPSAPPHSVSSTDARKERGRACQKDKKTGRTCRKDVQRAVLSPTPWPLPYVHRQPARSPAACTGNTNPGPCPILTALVQKSEPPLYEHRQRQEHRASSSTASSQGAARQWSASRHPCAAVGAAARPAGAAASYRLPPQPPDHAPSPPAASGTR
eukprot:157146-Chlamydomonas_euryale.AAC.4